MEIYQYRLEGDIVHANGEKPSGVSLGKIKQIMQTNQHELRKRLKALPDQRNDEAREIRRQMCLNRRGPRGLRALTKHGVY